MKPILDIQALTALVQEIAQEVIRTELGERADDWLDQAHSPLGRRMHCRLVRTGALPGVSVHRRVLVRRRDLDAYIEARRGPPREADDLEPLRQRFVDPNPGARGRQAFSPDEAAARARALGFDEAEARVLARVGARRVQR